MVSDAPIIEHEYVLSTIIYYWWRGQWQHIRWRIPGVSPAGDPTHPPSWWYKWWTLYDWQQNHHPDTWLPYLWVIRRYQEGAQRLLGTWIDEVGGWAKAYAIWWMYEIVGRPKHGERLVYSFLRYLDVMLGVTLPTWAITVVGGLVSLYDWFPSDITSGAVTFYDKFSAWYNTTLSWVRVNYDTARNWVANVAPGLTAGYTTVRYWYDIVATWVTNFKNDPYGTVAGWLGAAWTTWVVLRYAVVDFCNNVWAPYGIILHDFLDHPMLFLYDVFDDEIEGHLETASRWVGKIAEKIIEWGWNYG